MKTKFYCIAAPPLFWWIIQDTSAIVSALIALFVLIVLLRLFVNFLRHKNMWDNLAKVGLRLLILGFLSQASISFFAEQYGNDYYVGYLIFALFSFLALLYMRSLFKKKIFLYLMVIPVVALILAIVVFVGIKNEYKNLNSGYNSKGLPVDSVGTGNRGGTPDLGFSLDSGECGSSHTF